MPFYTCICQADLLNAKQKQKIATGITDIHCDLTGAPRHFVHVIFQSYAGEDGYSGGKRSQAAFIRGSIRLGRTQQVKEQLLSQLSSLWLELCPRTRKSDLLVTLIEVPGTNAMEGGILLPHPKDDATWELEHGINH
jgi:phenylpyruvate tautomerase PptA (4-oxalocrotonate tautomerase family)